VSILYLYFKQKKFGNSENKFSDFSIEYLGEYEAICKTVLACYSGTYMGLIDEKTESRKFRDTVPLKGTLWCYWHHGNFLGDFGIDFLGEYEAICEAAARTLGGLLDEKTEGQSSRDTGPLKCNCSTLYVQPCLSTLIFTISKIFWLLMLNTYENVHT
jgi:hypothetical protein